MGLFNRKSPDRYEGENLVEEIYGRQTEREISEIELNAERLEAYERMRSRKRRKSFLRVTGAVLLLTVLTSAVVYTGYRFLFIINEINIVGESPYSDAEICDGAGVNSGDALFSFSSVKAEERLMSALPYIGSLKVDRHIPDSVTFTVKYESAVYYTKIYGKIYLMSDSLRLLGEAEDTDISSLVWLRLPGVKEAVLGSLPVLRETDAGERLANITELVENSALKGRMTQMDLRSDYKLSMVCDGKYLLEFGDYTEVETKLRIAAAVLEDDMFKTQNKARIDLSNLSETTVVVDNQLDLTK